MIIVYSVIYWIDGGNSGSGIYKKHASSKSAKVALVFVHHPVAFDIDFSGILLTELITTKDDLEERVYHRKIRYVDHLQNID